MDINKEIYNHIKRLRPTLDKKNKFIFFEVKKAGTNSVRRGALKKRSIIYKDNKETYDDLFKLHSLDDVRNMFKFTIVRNPYARVVSAFHYLKKYKKMNNINFKKFIKTVFKGSGPSINIHFHEMIYKVRFKDKVFVDFIAKLENINDDWKKIAKRIGGPKTLPHINKGRHSDYKQYYDDECKKIIAKIYERDIDFFEYKF